jgi:hypothetical protein
MKLTKKQKRTLDNLASFSYFFVSCIASFILGGAIGYFIFCITYHKPFL